MNLFSRERVMIEIPTIEELPQMLHDDNSEGYAYPEEYQNKLFLNTNDSKYYFFVGAKAMPIDRGVIDVIIPFVHDAIEEKLDELNVEDTVNDIIEPQFQDVEDAFVELRDKFDIYEKENVKDYVAKELKIVHDNMEELIDIKVKEFEDVIMEKIKLITLPDSDGRSGEGALTIGKIMAMKELGMTSKDIANLAPYIK